MCFTCSLFLFLCLFVIFAAVLALLQPPQLAVPASPAQALHSGGGGQVPPTPTPCSDQPSPPECRPSPPPSQRTAYVCRLLTHNFSVFLFCSSVLHLHPCRYCSFVLSPHPPPPRTAHYPPPCLPVRCVFALRRADGLG